MSAHAMFQAKVETILAAAGPARAEAQAAVDEAFRDVPVGADKSTVGKLVWPRLKLIEQRYKAPPPPTLSKAEKLDALHAAGVLDGELLTKMQELAGQPGAGACVEAAYGQLERTTAGCADKTLLVGAYTQVCGFLFEQSRLDIGRRIAGAWRANPMKKRSVRYRGVRNGRVEAMSSSVDNDVPIIPGRIWETKWYVRANYGADPHAANQVLKYQAAVDAGYFETVTIEVHGNIDPTFLCALCEGREVAPGLELFAPDVELVYAVDEEVSVTLKASRNAKSMARSNNKAPAVRLAVLNRKYDLFSNKVITEADLSPTMVLDLVARPLSIYDLDYDVVDRARLLAASRIASVTNPLLDAVHEGFVDPERITDVAAFRLYERLVAAKRRQTWGL